MRDLLRFLCVCVLAVVQLAGCGDSGGACNSAADGATCGDGAGTCQQGTCQVACTEDGIRDAVALGGGPFTFDCDGPRTVVTRAEIVIDRNVILDGEGKLTVDGNDSHRVFRLPRGVAAILNGITITGGYAMQGNGGAIANGGKLTLNRCTVTGNTAGNGRRGHGGGIYNTGRLTLSDSTVSGNSARGRLTQPILCLFPPCSPYLEGGDGGGIANEGGDGPQTGPGIVTLINTTVSGNTADGWGGGVASWNGGTLELVHSTLSRSSRDLGSVVYNGDAGLNVTGSIIKGGCRSDGDSFSGGYNVESPGNTCGFRDITDQVNISEQQLSLGPLQNNGGSTETHALGTGSVAIDVIPRAECEVDTDQRGEPRDSMCDVGAFEAQPESNDERPTPR